MVVAGFAGYFLFSGFLGGGGRVKDGLALQEEISLEPNLAAPGSTTLSRTNLASLPKKKAKHARRHSKISKSEAFEPPPAGSSTDPSLLSAPLPAFSAPVLAPTHTPSSASPPSVDSTASTDMPRASSSREASVAASTAPVANPAPPIDPIPPPRYLVSVSSVGAGMGSVSSDPKGILCGFDCQYAFTSGTELIFRETPAVGALFKGWSGACHSTSSGISAPEDCSLVVSSSVAIVAYFDLASGAESVPLPAEPVPPPLASEPVAAGSSSPATPTDPASSNVGHALIAQIQIAGAARSNSFVKLYNPGESAIDVSGWKLRKKSSTGKSHSLRVFPRGSSISPRGYFTWANSKNGFARSIGADVSSSASLATKNSVALFDSSGTMIDAVAWGAGTDQYVESHAYPADPAASQVLGRKYARGAIVDTQNNASDFVLQ